MKRQSKSRLGQPFGKFTTELSKRELIGGDSFVEADSKYAMLYAGSSQDLFDAKNFHSVQRVRDPSIYF